MEQLDEALRAQLDSGPVRPVVEYIGRRLGLDEGEQRMKFQLSNGRLRESDFNRARIRNEELEALAGRRR